MPYPIYTHLKVKFAIIVKGDPEGPFSIVTTPKYKGGH